MSKIMENELNMVTGGTVFETASDSHALCQRRCMHEEYNFFDLLCEWTELSKRVDEGWFNAGVISVTRPFKSNRYLKNGKEISRKQALQTIGF